MATSRSIFELADSELVGGQTISDIGYWVLGIVLLIDFVTGGMIFSSWFSNFGLTAKAFSAVQIILFAYCVAMVFGESKAVKNVITTIGFWTLLILATVMTNSNSKILQTYQSFSNGISSSTPSFNYNANVANPGNPVIVPQRQAAVAPRNTQANADATKWNRIGVGQKLLRGNKLTPQGLQWCKTADANKTNQGRLHCKTGFTWTKNGWSNKNDTF